MFYRHCTLLVQTPLPIFPFLSRLSFGLLGFRSRWGGVVFFPYMHGLTAPASLL